MAVVLISGSSGFIGNNVFSRIPFVASVPLDGHKIMEDYYIDGPLQFSINNAVEKKIGAECVARVIANGVNVPSFDNMYQISGSADYVNTQYQLNLIMFWWDGATMWFSIQNAVGGLALTPDVPDVTAPVLVTAVVQNATPGVITLSYSEILDEASIPDVADFSASGKTVTAVNISGSTVSISVNTVYVNGDSIVVSYTPGASPIQDAAGNDVAALSNRAVTNSIAGAASVITMTQTSNLTVNGEQYTATSDATSYSGRAICALTSTPGVESWIECQRPATDTACYIGFDTSGLVSLAHTACDYTAGISGTGSVVYGTNSSSPSDTGYVLPVGSGSRIRLRRASTNNIALQTTVDDGATWTTRYLFPGTNTSVLSPHFYTTFSTTARSLYEPRHFGLTA